MVGEHKTMWGKQVSLLRGRGGEAGKQSGMGVFHGWEGDELSQKCSCV